MKALITGASSGIGYSMAKYLSSLGYDLILVSRDKEKLQRIQRELKTDVKIVVADLSQEAKLKELYVLLKNDDIDMLVNNAGFGLFGEFSETDLSTEMDMINVNIRAVHVLTKLFLKDMIKKDSGYILNVSSSAGFQAGPLMATYYATKSYVTKLTLAIYEELRRSKSKVKVSCLCPGPVKTNFNDVANVKFAMKGMDSDKVAKYAIDKTLKGKTIIIPGFKMKMAIFFNRFVSNKFAAKVIYNFQKRKRK
jgi:short-subunit dehydrogenase